MEGFQVGDLVVRRVGSMVGISLGTDKQHRFCSHNMNLLSWLLILTSW